MNIFEKFWSPVKKEEKQEVKEVKIGERRSPIPSPEERILVSDKPKSEKKLGRGLTEASFVEMGEAGAGIFKEEGYQNERAAYIVDRFFNFELVPITVIRNIGGRMGSLQQFIPDACIGDEVENKKINQEKLKEMRFFDFLICNTDRYGGNYLIKDNEIFAIDHHLAFWQGISGSSGYNEILGKKIPHRIRNEITRFSEWEEGRLILDSFLKELLGEKNVASFWKRFECLAACVKKGKFLNRKEFDKLKV